MLSSFAMVGAEPALGSQGPALIGRVQRRKARTRSSLVAAARTLFAARGVEPTTIAEIAEQADVAVGSFYNYFATKDELLAAMIEQVLGEERRALESRQAQVTDPAEVISIAHRHLIRMADSDPDLAWLLVRLELSHDVATSVLREAARLDLQRGIDAGRFSVSNPDLAITASGGALLAVLRSQLAGERAEQADSEHAEGVLRAFGLDPREAAEIARRPLPALPR
jgi:AcrR family transcriptional regulator